MNKNIAHKIGRHCFHFSHIGYFAAVAVEGHGYYASMAGILFVLSLLNAWFHFE